MSNEKVFADGIRFFGKSEKAPDYVIGSLKIEVEEAIAFLNKHASNNEVKLSIKLSSKGKYYIELDTYVGKGKVMVESSDDTGLPF